MATSSYKIQINFDLAKRFYDACSIANRKDAGEEKREKKKMMMKKN